LGIICNPHP